MTGRKQQPGEYEAGAAVAVVGCTCPLGRQLVDSLLGKGHQVFGLHRAQQAVPLAWAKNARFQGAQFDLGEPQALARLLAISPRVVWLAQTSYASPQMDNDVDLAALQAVLAQPGPLFRKIVLLSSGGSIYGNPDRLPVDELHPCRPLSPYGHSKKRMEEALIAHTQKDPSLSCTIVRCANIYGWEYLAGRVKGCVAAFMDALLHDRPVPLIANGHAVRDFIHVEDVVQAIFKSLENPAQRTIWNVGSGTGIRVREVLAMVCEILKRGPSQIHHIKPSATDVDEIFLDIRKIKAESGWRPAFTLRQGLEQILDRLQNDEHARALSAALDAY